MPSSLHQGLLGMPVRSDAPTESLSWGEEQPLLASLPHPRLPGELTKNVSGARFYISVAKTDL